MFAADNQRFAIQSGRFAHIRRRARGSPPFLRLSGTARRGQRNPDTQGGAPLSERRHENALADGLRIQFIINALHILTTFFCTFLHVCAHFGRLVNSVREAFPIFALSEEGEADGKAPAQEGFYMILRAARNGRKGGTAGAANSAGLNAQGAGDARSSRMRRRLTVAILAIDFAVMVRRKKRFVPLYVRIGKESGKDSDACILLVALRCGRKRGAFEGAVFFG